MTTAELVAAPVRRPWPWKLRLGVAVVALYCLVAVLAPLLAIADPNQRDILDRLAAPSLEHPFGTDALGRDVWSRLVYATRLDLWVAFLAAFLPLVIGTVLGAAAGFRGRVVDTIVMRTADVVQAFPIYIFIIALAFALGTGVKPILTAFAAVAWVVYARLVRTEVLRVRGLDYVLAARTGGLSETRVLVRHVLPNVLSQTFVYFFSDIVLAVLTLSAFSFLGFGVPPPTPEWGAMIADGQTYIQEQWWLTTAPALAIVGLGIGLSLIADGLDDRWRT